MQNQLGQDSFVDYSQHPLLSFFFLGELLSVPVSQKLACDLFLVDSLSQCSCLLLLGPLARVNSGRQDLGRGVP